MKKKWILNTIIIICVLVFIVSGIYLLRYYHAAKTTENELEELQELRTEGEAETGDSIQTSVGTILNKYKKLYKKNSDLIGWITVQDTQIDYPVMQTKKDSEYYLHKNYKKEYDINGLPFLDANCDINDRNSNLMVYGHHMKSGMMFAHLVDYDAESFYKKHKIVQFDTIYEKREYEIVAAFYSKIYDKADTAFKYYEYLGKLSEKQFNSYIKNVKKLSQYETGITPKYGEQLLTMVTCSYQTEDGRFVVVARRKA